MFKKILAALSTVALVLVFTPSAQATADLVQTDKLSRDNYIQGQSIQFVQVNPNLRLALWGENSNSEITYMASVVSADGHLGSTVQIGSSGTGMAFVPNLRFAVSSNHLLAVAYEQSTDNGNGYSSTINLVYSDDGIHWSAPVSALPPVDYQMCDPFMDFGCGYTAHGLLFDKLDHLELLATFGQDFHRASMVATSSSDGVVWANPTRLAIDQESYNWSLFENSSDPVSFVSSASGIFAAWYIYNPVDGSRQVWSARMPDPAHPFWLTAVNDYSTPGGSNLDHLHLQGTSNGSVVETFWETQNGQHTTLKSMTWSPTSKSWSTPTTIHTVASEWMSYLVYSEVKNNLSAFSWIEYSNGQDDLVKSLVFVDGVPGTVSTMRSGAGDGTGNDQVFTTSVAADSTVSSAFYNYSLRKAYLLEQTPGGTTVTTELPVDLSYNYASRISEDAVGNLTVLAQWVPDSGQGNDLVVYQKTRASAPIANGPIVLRGTAKVGKTLTAQAPPFGSISGVGTTTYKWFACTKQVKSFPSAIPKTCKVIKGATKSTLKLTKAQKKTFVMFQALNQNAVGLSTVFSTSTKAVG